MSLFRDFPHGPAQQFPKTFGAFREHLIGIPSREMHGGNYPRNVRQRNALVEQIAHRVDEDHPRFAPTKRLSELLGNKPQIKTVLEWMLLHPTKPLSKPLGVAVLAARTDFRATANGIP